MLGGIGAAMGFGSGLIGVVMNSSGLGDAGNGCAVGKEKGGVLVSRLGFVLGVVGADGCIGGSDGLLKMSSEMAPLAMSLMARCNSSSVDDAAGVAGADVVGFWFILPTF